MFWSNQTEISPFWPRRQKAAELCLVLYQLSRGARRSREPGSLFDPTKYINKLNAWVLLIISVRFDSTVEAGFAVFEPNL